MEKIILIETIAKMRKMMGLNETQKDSEQLIREISLKSSGIQEFVDYLNDNPAAIAYLGFKNMYSLIEYINDNGVNDWDQLRTELEAYKKTQGHESDPDFDDPIK